LPISLKRKFQITLLLMERIIYFVGIAIMFLIATQCGSRYNTIEFKDKNKGDERIYGEAGGPARQSKVSYPEDTVQKRKAIEIREKLYGDQNTKKAM